VPVLQGALLCDSAKEYNGLVSVLGGFVSILNVPSLPALSPVVFAGRVGFSIAETKNPHHIRIVVTSDNGVLAEVVGSVPPLDPKTVFDPEFAVGMNLIFPLPVQFDQAGMYWFELTIDEDLMVRLPLKVNLLGS